MFVQPAAQNYDTTPVRRPKFLLFQIFENEISILETGNSTIHLFCRTPKLNNSPVLKEASFQSWDKYRFVLRNEDFLINSEQILSREIQDAFKFEVYKDSQTGNEYLISIPISQIPADRVDFIMSFWVVSLLEILEPPQGHSYDFNSRFVGWNLIVFPFICFIHGLALIAVKHIYAKIVHLVQSSGYGKTRLCFEFLKYQKRGIYCVYRPADYDNGFPKTTPWFEALVLKFKESNSDKESVQICMNFICWAIENFGQLDSSHYDCFVGDAIFSEEFSCKTKTAAEVRSALKGELFTIIIDECQELLITPRKKPELISLYRAFKRAMNDIKELPIVTVFLGTKSSLGDFVLSGHYKPSFREDLALPGEVFDLPVYLFTHSCNSMSFRAYNVSYQTVATYKLIDGIKLPRSFVMQDVAWDSGRPLWRQYSSFGKAFDTGRLKLVGDANIKELASLIMRTGSTVTPQDHLAHRLVLSGMATLAYVDVDGSRCYIEYIPEPILTNNARLQMYNRSFYIKGLDEYNKKMELGVFHEAGEAGEQVARMVLLRIMDLACLYPHRGDKKAAKFHINAEHLIGNGAQKLKIASLFAEKLEEIHRSSSTENWNVPADSPLDSPDTKSFKPPLTGSNAQGSAPSTTDATTSNASNQVNLAFLSPSIALCTVKEFLLLLSCGAVDDEFQKFGVSDEVMNGVLSFAQFVKLRSPMHINQAYLMHAFARGCAFILADYARGADLVIPVLRTDNKMSCIAVQIKNLQESFPDDVITVTSGLSKDSLGFLDFGSVADFEAALADDFIRIVIQFGPVDGKIKRNCNEFFWSQIPNSDSCIPTRTGPCHALWLFGLKALGHCFFNDKEILSLLNTILSRRHDVYRHLNYPSFPLPTYLQSTEEGARFLGKLARPLANYSNLAIFDQQMRDETSERGKYEWDLMEKTLNLLQLPSNSFDHFSQSKFSPQVPLPTISEQNADEADETDETNKTDKTVAKQDSPILSNADVELLNSVKSRCQLSNGPLAELLTFHDQFKFYRRETMRVGTPLGAIRKQKSEFQRAESDRILLSIMSLGKLLVPNENYRVMVRQLENEETQLLMEEMTIDDGKEKAEDNYEEDVALIFSKKRKI